MCTVLSTLLTVFEIDRYIASASKLHASPTHTGPSLGSHTLYIPPLLHRVSMRTLIQQPHRRSSFISLSVPARCGVSSPARPRCTMYSSLMLCSSKACSAVHLRACERPSFTPLTHLSFLPNSSSFSCERMRCIALKSCTVPLRALILMAALVFHSGAAAAAASSATIARHE